MILDMILYIKMHFPYFLCPAAADPHPAQRVDETGDDCEPDRPMDFDKHCDYADQGPLTDMDMEEDTELPSLLRLAHTIRILWYRSTSRLKTNFDLTLPHQGRSVKASVRSGLHKEVSLVYFFTFEPNYLTQDSIM
jgi:hypothetical protein